MDDLERLNTIEPVSPRMLRRFRCDPQLPSLASRAISYSGDVVGFIAGKFKTRTDEEIDTNWKVCQECDSLVDEFCIECGCPISKEGLTIKNKLKMANTRCSKGLWLV
jgi:hypothetical protein